MSREGNAKSALNAQQLAALLAQFSVANSTYNPVQSTFANFLLGNAQSGIEKENLALENIRQEKKKESGLGALFGAGSGALSGAGTGALIGSVVPGIGTAIGAGIGAGAGGTLGGVSGSGLMSKQTSKGATGLMNSASTFANQYADGVFSTGTGKKAPTQQSAFSPGATNATLGLQKRKKGLDGNVYYDFDY